MSEIIHASTFNIIKSYLQVVTQQLLPLVLKLELLHVLITVSC